MQVKIVRLKKFPSKLVRDHMCDKLPTESKKHTFIIMLTTIDRRKFYREGSFSIVAVCPHCKEEIKYNVINICKR
jgi:hypothetical protein